MLEQAIERLTSEVAKLREAVERQASVLARGPVESVTVVSEPPCQNATRQEAYLTERAVAELLGLSAGLLRKWRLFRTGPPYLKLGRLVRYSRADVLVWIKEQTPKALGYWCAAPMAAAVRTTRSQPT